MNPEYSWNYIISAREWIGVDGATFSGEVEEIDKSEFSVLLF